MKGRRIFWSCMHTLITVYDYVKDFLCISNEHFWGECCESSVWLEDCFEKSWTLNYFLLIEYELSLIVVSFYCLKGKEAILNAIAALCTASNKAVSGEEPITSNSIVTAVLTACTKKSKSYREAAFSCLKQVLIFNLHIATCGLLMHTSLRKHGCYGCRERQ